MAIPVLALTAIGGAVSAFGALQSGAASSAMYNYQAGVARINQQISLQNAQYARMAGETEAQQTGMQTRARLGGILAQQGASNLDVMRGSAVDVRASAAEVGAEDQAMVRANAARRAYGYEAEATGFQAQAGLDVAAASQSRTASYFGAASSLLGGATSVADKWYRMTASGVSPSVVS